MDDSKHTRLTELTTVEEAFESLRKENLRVIKGNIDLREGDKYLSLFVSDLNVKLKGQEQEIKSFVTTIMLLQDDKRNQPEKKLTTTWHSIQYLHLILNPE